MKHIVLTAVIGLLMFSCQRTDLGNLEETLYVRNNGADMPAYVRGNGSSNTFILMVHGGPGGNGLEYRAGTYAEQLEEQYAMVYWDQRGQGMSQGKYADTEVTVAQMADDLRALIGVVKAHYGEDIRIFVLGHSWGGMLTAKFMVTGNNQNLIDGWIESNGAHDIPKLNRAAIKLFLEVGQSQVDAGNSVADWQAILTWAEAIDTNNISTEEGGEINEKGFEAEKLLTDDGVILEGEGGAFSLLGPTNPLTSFLSGNYTSQTIEAEVESTSLTAELSVITVPCLFLWGQYDFVVPPRLGIDAFEQVQAQDKELIIFERSGHSPMDNEPDAYVSAIEAFIGRN